MAPMRTMAREITQARTGRSMKMRASIGGFSRARRRGRHVDELRLDRDPRPDLEQAADDHPVTRRHALLDLPQTVVVSTNPDGTGDHLVPLVDDVDDLLALVVVDGALVDEQGSMGFADGRT